MVTRFNSKKTLIVALIIGAIVLVGAVSAFITFKPTLTAQAPPSTPSPTATSPSVNATHPTGSPTPTPMPTSTVTPATTETPTPTPSPTTSPTPTATPTPSPSPSPSPTPSPTPSATPTPTPTPSPSPTPTPTPNPQAHTVDDSTLMQGNEDDYWNVTETGNYTVTLNDSLTVTGGDQDLQVIGLSGNITNTWEVFFQNSTGFQYVVWDDQGNQLVSGSLNYTEGNVTVQVSESGITFTGDTPVSIPVNFVNLGQIWTSNAGGDFDGGELDITATAT